MSDPTSEPRPVRTAVSATTTLAVVVAVVAVVIGFLILRDISDSGGTSSPAGPSVQTTQAPTATDAAGTTTTVKPRRTTTTLLTTGFEVMVANASGVGGSAGQMTDQLKAKGYVLAEPTNAASGTPTQSVTVVYALPGFEEGGASVAAVLGGVEVQPMPDPVPVDGSLGSASVLVMLGTDLAGKDLPKQQRASAGNSDTTTTTVAG